MRCAWQEFLSILPVRLRNEVDNIGHNHLQELRLRVNAPPELVFSSGSVWLKEVVKRAELEYIINVATKYSPWCMDSAKHGYFTVSGGHRIGLCGEAVFKNDQMQGFRVVNAVSIRVARDYPGIGKNLASISGSVIILGAPGWGKTTLLRDVVRHIGEKKHICVVDERQELFPEGFESGRCTDVLSGCPKKIGVEMLIRTMGPQYIAVDEITAEEDANALVHAHGCGVFLWATTHADSMDAFFRRTTYRPLVEKQVFQYAVVMKKDKTFCVERVGS